MSITKLNSHYKLLFSIAIAVVAALLTRGRLTPAIEIMVIWLGYAATHLTLSWITIFNIHPIEMQKQAKDQDSSRTLIFVFVLIAAVVSLAVVLLLLRATADLKDSELMVHVLFSIASVISSWLIVHTLFVFRYAHLYYDEAEKKSGSAKSHSKYVEGLEFPEEREPDYLDFMYFSFVIGMTFQVSDVEISSRRIRRLALMHSMIAFAFNTVIVALSINIISSLIQK